MLIRNTILKFFIKSSVLIYLGAGVFGIATAQNFFRTDWEKTFNINLSDKVHSVMGTSDGSFILAGETTSPAIPGQKILIIRLNSEGELIWQKTFGDNSDCKFISLAQAEKDHILFLGSKQSGISKPLIWVMKINKDGKLIWENTIGGGDADFMFDLCETPDDGVFLCGSKVIKGNNDSDGWLVKFNRRGSVESQALFGSRFINDEFRTIIPNRSGGFLIAGFTSERLGSERIPYILNVDSRGNKIWEKSYPEFPGAVPSSLFFSSDGLIECLTNVYSKTGEFSGITKILLNISGGLIHNYTTKRSLNISKNAFAATTDDQLILLSMQADDPSAFSDKYIIKLDKVLEPVWIKPLEIESVSLRAVAPIDNSNFIAVGWAGQTSYKHELRAFAFRDYSVDLIENYVKQKLLATAGMEMNESLSDFKGRIGNVNYENFIRQFTSDAVTDLRLIPQDYAINTQTGRETRPSIMASVTRDAESPREIALEGKYYALLIAVNDYTDPMINDLDKPVSDARKLFDVLVNEYLFEKANVTFLKNPTREEIITALDRFESEITRADNLLIFYAGHGYWNETTQRGFWLPSDASKQNTANWIGNSTISDYIRSIPARHTLLIADACFSGSIFKTRSAFGNLDVSAMRLYELTSRKAMTSGTLTEVPDKSVFIDFLVKRLYDNKEDFLASEQLFFSFKPAVINNTETIPQFGVVGNAGDEGGDFIFIRRGK